MAIAPDLGQVDRFAKTRELLDRKSAESGIPVRFQQPFETITPFS